MEFLEGIKENGRHAYSKRVRVDKPGLPGGHDQDEWRGRIKKQQSAIKQTWMEGILKDREKSRRSIDEVK